MASLAVDTNAEAQQLLEAEGNALWTNIRQIGTGGSGSVVFKAYDKYVEQDVALKVIKVEREADRQRLEREPKALEKIFASDLDDTNICKFYKWGYLANPTWLYIKMELADGGTLSERLATLQEPMSEREALQMALSILSALATVHEKKLVHRDIKPQNILLVDSAYKLADFGLAFEPTDTVPAAANTFQTMSLGGTPQYSSPEQLMEQTLAPQTDLWSLAVTMYQCLSGRLPFGEHPAMAIGNIMSRNPPPSLVDVSNGRVAPEVASIVAKAMAFDPNDRFLSATAMADAIRDALSDYDVFISYRRTHQEYGRKIKEELRRHGLKAFLDIDPEDGLTIGDFQAQLERVLEHTPTVFMLVTPAPSGPDQRAAGGIDRSSVSSMGHIVEYLNRGWTDWCELEMRRSLELHKQIVPIYSKSWNGEPYIGAELGKIGHLDSVKQLRSLNAFDVDVNDVTSGVERIVQHLRKKNLDRSKMSSQEKLKDEEEKALLKAKLISERRKKEEAERLRREEEVRRKKEEEERLRREEEERHKREEALSKKIEELQQIEHLKHVSTECLKGIYETLKRLNLPVDDLLGITGKQTLDLRQIGDAGAQAIGEALKVNQTLQTLNLWNNQIGAAGAQAIGEALKVNQTLQTLCLSDNEIGYAGAAAIGDALKVNTTLQTLNLRYNQIGAAGAQAIGDALKVNQTLQTLVLGLIGDAGKAVIKAAWAGRSDKLYC